MSGKSARPIVAECSCGRAYTVSQFDALPLPSSGRASMEIPAGDDGPAYVLIF